MKRIVAKSTLIKFWNKYPDSEQYLKTWYDTLRKSNWNNPSEIKSILGTASILKNNRVVFNIKGNHYRLIVRFNYDKQWAFIRFIGTHKEFDKINADEV